jgi:drug/metabolite transporter (DMT)-like permease
VSRKLQADLLLAFCTLIWGATFVIVKEALADASVFAFLALRFLLAAIVLAALFRRQLRGLGLAGLRGGVLIGCFLFGGYAFQTAGIRLTTPSKAAFITGFSVVLVPVLLAVFGGRRVHRGVWAGAVSSLAGLYFLTVPPSGLRNLNSGDLLVLCGAVFFALHIISVGHYTPRHPAGALTLLQVTTTAALSAGMMPLLSITGMEPVRIVWTGALAAAIAVTGVLATALAFSAQVWAQKHTSASHTAILFALEPVFAGLTSILFTQEQIGRRALAGAALILAGILLAELRGPAPAAPESAIAANPPYDPGV